MLEDNFASDFLNDHHLQITKKRICLLLKNLDQLENLNICFALDFLF